MDVNVLWNPQSDRRRIGIIFLPGQGRVKAKIVKCGQVGPAAWGGVGSIGRSL